MENDVMAYFLTDVKKLYKNKLVILALTILFVAAVIDPVTMRREYEQFRNPFMWWLFMNRGAGSTIFNTLHWFFPVLLTGLVYFDENRTAIYGILITKKKRSTYFLSKALSVFVVAFFSLLCLFLLNLLLVYLVCPSDMAVKEYLIPKADTFAGHLYQKSPLYEAVIYNVLRALSIALLSTLYLAMHMIIKPRNKYLALILPPLVMYMFDHITQIMAITYSITIILQPVVASATSFMITGRNFIITFGVLIAIVIVCFLIGCERNRDIV